jgi:peptidoglycan hydrolase-like amidase
MLALAVAATVKIGVFGLFHPVELDLRPVVGSALIVEQDGSKHEVFRGDVIHLKAGSRATGRNGAVTTFMLSVPGKIHREFRGRLEVKQSRGWLVPVIEMDRELAVASIADSEMIGVPLEAMKAQAVATRSYLAGVTGRHAGQGFDFCDTTHCQYLHGRPRAGTNAQQAVDLTRDLTLTHQGKILAALYSANCGGHTHTLQEVGWKHDGVYPFFGVSCPVKGNPDGHGVGMCQRGAMELARTGAQFRDILAHFFPASALETVKLLGPAGRDSATAGF